MNSALLPIDHNTRQRMAAILNNKSHKTGYRLPTTPIEPAIDHNAGVMGLSGCWRGMEVYDVLRTQSQRRIVIKIFSDNIM
jgi:hypothetical protein